MTPRLLSFFASLKLLKTQASLSSHIYTPNKQKAMDYRLEVTRNTDQLEKV